MMEATGAQNPRIFLSSTSRRANARNSPSLTVRLSCVAGIDPDERALLTSSAELSSANARACRQPGVHRASSCTSTSLRTPWFPFYLARSSRNDFLFCSHVASKTVGINESSGYRFADTGYGVYLFHWPCTLFLPEKVDPVLANPGAFLLVFAKLLRSMLESAFCREVPEIFSHRLMVGRFAEVRLALFLCCGVVYCANCPTA